MSIRMQELHIHQTVGPSRGRLIGAAAQRRHGVKRFSQRSSLADVTHESTRHTTEVAHQWIHNRLALLAIAARCYQALSASIQFIVAPYIDMCSIYSATHSICILFGYVMWRKAHTHAPPGDGRGGVLTDGLGCAFSHALIRI